ncbi:MAG: heparan-alpha-glucosaminide N-acetyltransferase domain-containing protein [Myxococcota bacterium]
MGAGSSVGSAEAAITERWGALDVLRLVAVVLMVQGHTFTALLDPAFRVGGWDRPHAYLHGLTAPMFLFASGLAFGVATFRRWTDHARTSPATRRRFERYGWLLFIGYALSLPKMSFRRLFGESSADNARTFFRVDALENIGVSLLVLQALVLVLKRPRPFVAAVFVLGAGLVFGAPAAWRMPAEALLPLALAAYVNVNTGSILPLFPWAGFIFAGVLTAYGCLDRSMSLRPHRAFGLGVTGLLLWWVATALAQHGFNCFGEHNYWKTSPIFFFVRLGLLLLGLSLLCFGEALVTRRSTAPKSDSPGWMARTAQETLVIYVTHLFLLYGSPINHGIARFYRNDLSIAMASAVALLILSVSVGVALCWRYARDHYPVRFRRFQKGTALLVVLVALFKP